MPAFNDDMANEGSGAHAALTEAAQAGYGDPARAYELREIRAQIRQTFCEYSERARQIWVGRFVDQLSWSELSDQVGYDAQTEFQHIKSNPILRWKLDRLARTYREA